MIRDIVDWYWVLDRDDSIGEVVLRGGNHDAVPVGRISPTLTFVLRFSPIDFVKLRLRLAKLTTVVYATLVVIFVPNALYLNIYGKTGGIGDGDLIDICHNGVLVIHLEVLRFEELAVDGLN